MENIPKIIYQTYGVKSKVPNKVYDNKCIKFLKND